MTFAAWGPDWESIQSTSDEEDAFDELLARQDRADAHAASTFPICPGVHSPGQRPAFTARASSPQPPRALATGRAAATGDSLKGGLGARTPEAA